MMRFKGSFSICKICLAYEVAIKGHNTIAQREQLDRDFLTHLTETKKERAQWSKDQIKCGEEKDKFAIIMDSIDKWKTTFPFFVNPPKSVVEGAMVFGCGVKAGVYTFWANEQVQHDSNLTIEVLRRTLLKLEECGPLPRRMYLQLDNASDNKSAQFLALLAYLIEKGCFDCIKLSYLIVGHTHDIIDQWFSVLSKYEKRFVLQVLSIASFLHALTLQCFKTEKCIPKCAEQVQYCYDTKELATMFIDKDFHRFDLDEITGDKTHHFVFRRNNEMKCVMQYKLKRYSDALYPRAYKALGAKYVSPTNGVGVVTNFKAFKNECKKNFWTYTVLYSNPATGTTFEEKVALSAKDTSILMFPKCEGGPASLPDTFPLATFRTDFSENVEEQKQSIQQIFKALNLCETHANDLKHWQEYFDSMPNNPENVTNLKPFIIPNTFLNSAIPNNTNVRKAALPIDDGIRDVDPVTFIDFNRIPLAADVHSI